MVTVGARTGKWLAVALVASLAVNIFVGGLYAAHWLMRPPHMVMMQRANAPDRGMPGFLDRIGEALPLADRSTWRGIVTKHQPEIAATGSAVREARRHVRDLLSADVVDPKALDAAFGELRERQAKFQQTLQATITEAALALPAPARRQMIDASRRGPVRE